MVKLWAGQAPDIILLTTRAAERYGVAGLRSACGTASRWLSNIEALELCSRDTPDNTTAPTSFGGSRIGNCHGWLSITPETRQSRRWPTRRPALFQSLPPVPRTLQGHCGRSRPPCAKEIGVPPSSRPAWSCEPAPAADAAIGWFRARRCPFRRSGYAARDRSASRKSFRRRSGRCVRAR